MKGYKVFNPDWQCQGYQFEVGKIFEEDGKPKCCDKGFHFCKKLSDCFNYYKFDCRNKIAEVEVLGDIDISVNGDSKCCTNKIHIIRELTWNEALELVNTGKNCIGRNNSGNRNSGDCNSGNRNSGYCNSGNYNSGNRNSGDWNSGNRNSGYWNSGDYNSGDYNSGYWNSGDWNKTNFSSGCFNTEETKIFLFNKFSDWTYKDWKNSDARNILAKVPLNSPSWIPLEDMTEEEKVLYPDCKVTEGFLKYIERETQRQAWWNNLSKREKEIVISIPNFDKDIFKEITGIDV